MSEDYVNFNERTDIRESAATSNDGGGYSAGYFGMHGKKKKKVKNKVDNPVEVTLSPEAKKYLKTLENQQEEENLSEDENS